MSRMRRVDLGFVHVGVVVLPLGGAGSGRGGLGVPGILAQGEEGS